MTVLPPGWANTNIGEIGVYLNGRGFRKAEWSDSGRPIIRIQNLTGTSLVFNYYAGEADESYIARTGDILISWAATLGVYVWRGPEAVVNQHIFKMRSHVDPDFHRYLVTFALQAMRRETHGSGIVHITRKRFDAIPVSLPPLAEQRRIVAAIEEQFSRLDAAQLSLSTIAVRLSMLADALVSRAVQGDWRTVSLSDVTEHQTYGSSAKCSVEPIGTPVLRMGNIENGRIVTRSLKYLASNHPDATKFRLAPGDLLFNRTNSPELVGKTAVYRGQPPTAAFASYLIRVRVTDDCLPAWTALVINSPLGREYVARVRTQQVGQANVNGTKLAAMPLPLPPLAEQRRIVAELERQLSLIDSLRAAVESAQKRSAALRRAILERAFRGELVPQDPDDEPASALLERIRAERAAAPPERRARIARVGR